MGGLAASEQGFKAETELTRMQQAGLLTLQRDPSPPFAVLKVGLSPAIRDLLADKNQAVSKDAAPKPQRSSPEPQEAERSDLGVRRKAFEVARGMICAVVKAEFSALDGQPVGSGLASVERRIMTRISELKTPFEQ